MRERSGAAARHGGLQQAVGHGLKRLWVVQGGSEEETAVSLDADLSESQIILIASCDLGLRSRPDDSPRLSYWPKYWFSRTVNSGASPKRSMTLSVVCRPAASSPDQYATSLSLGKRPRKAR